MEYVILRDIGVMEYGTALELQTEAFDMLVKEKERRNRKTAKEREDASGIAGNGTSPAVLHSTRTDDAQHNGLSGSAAVCKDAGTSNGHATAAEPGTSKAGGNTGNTWPQPGDTPAVRPEQYLFLCEHPHVYTLGMHGNENNLLVDETFLDRIGATYFRINRGGDITYHGYGQLVGYPVLDLERMDLSLKGYIEALEEAVIRCVAHYGIKAGRLQGATGVWIDAEGERYEGNAAGSMAWTVPFEDEKAGSAMPAGADTSGVPSGKARKICAIGVRASRHVTMHGFALNVNTDLSYFSYINPCGFADKGVTSIEKEIGREVDMQEVKRLFAECFEKELKCKLK